MKRLFFAIPILYGDPNGFWVRESGLIVRGLRKLGYEAFLIALDAGVKFSDDWPIITCKLENLSDPAWWKSLQPDAIVLCLWNAPRYDSVRKAALQVTPRVIERLDASGVRTPRIWPSYYFTQAWGLQRDQGANAVLSFITTVARFLAFSLMPGLQEKPMALTMAQLPYVVAESPLAAARVQRHISLHHDGPDMVAQISNPVFTDDMNFKPGDQKTNALVAIGRWESYQKDFPLLLRSAVKFLTHFTEWTFDIVGRGTEKYQGLLDQVPASVRARIHVHGPKPHPELAKINRAAKIHFLASRWEGFCVASVEALCCGCSYVGPINIAASSYLIENESGTLAPRRTADDLYDALYAEAKAWSGGRRDPVAISQKWIEQSGYVEVARRTADLIESIPAGRLGE